MTRPASLEEIDTRLRALPSSLTVTSEDARAIERLRAYRVVDAPRRSGRARLALALAAALGLVLLVNFGAAYFAPIYSQALAGAPVVGAVSGRALEILGVPGPKLTVVNDTSVSSGHTLRLVAGYADGLRTVLFIEIDGKALGGKPKTYVMQPGDYMIDRDGLSLTDQFGHTYQGGGGGSTEITFEPLAGAAAKVGARLSLHVTRLDALWLMPSKQGVVSAEEVQRGSVRGDWTLHATLVSGAAHSLALPAPLKTAKAVYTFSSVRSSDSMLLVTWTLSGDVNDRMHRLVDGYYGKNPVPPADVREQEMKLLQDYFSPTLFDSAGQQMRIRDYGSAFPKGKAAEGNIAAYIPGPGQYRLQLGGALTDPDQQVWIEVK
jgi:hypothetical protein